MEHNLYSNESVALDVLDYDRDKELSELMSTKAGVKGLVDSGISKVPRIFHLEADQYHLDRGSSDGTIQDQVPIIDLKGYDGERRGTIVNEISHASRAWGIFQVLNHGVPLTVMKNILESGYNFHEQPKELNQEYYSQDSSRKVRYYATVHSTLRAALWKDTIACLFENMSTDFEALPVVCRKPMSDFVKHIVELKRKVMQVAV